MTTAPLSAPAKRIRTKYRDFSDIPEIPMDLLPVAVEYRGSRTLGILSLFFGFAFTALPFVAVAKAFADKEMKAGTAAAAAVFCLAIFGPLVVYGFKQFRLKKVVRLDAEAVSWEDRGLGKTRTCSEPVRDFAGVRHFVAEHPTTGRYHVLKLEHADPSKSVVLSTNRDERGIPERWARFCRRLRLPAIENINSEFRFERSLDDLAPTVVELLRMGKLKLPARSADPPGGVERIVDGLETRLRCADSTELKAGPAGMELKRKQLLGGTSNFKWGDIESVDIRKMMRSRHLAIVLTHRLPIPSRVVQGDIPRLRTYFCQGLAESALIWLQYEILERAAASVRA